MFKNTKIVTGLFSFLFLLGLLQIVSYVFFFDAVKSDRQHFTVSQTVRQQSGELNASWIALIQTRNTINRAIARMIMETNNIPSKAKSAELIAVVNQSLDDADRHFAAYSSIPVIAGQAPALSQEIAARYQDLRAVLQNIVELIKTTDVAAIQSLPTQKMQDLFEKSFNAYVNQNASLNDGAMTNSANNYRYSIILIAAGIMVLLVAIISAWIYIRRILLQPLNGVIAHLHHISTGDLTQSLALTNRNEIGQLANSVRHMQQSLADTVDKVRGSADEIFHSASEIAGGNTDLASRTEQQSASLVQTAASMEQLTATVKQNADNARHASKLALSASDTANEGLRVVDDVVNTMGQISGSSRKISEITGLIDSIAFQTNILALNAAVEAARAGEQGRGFAVVASEVRNLAQRSAGAAKEIKALIDDSVNRVNEGGELVASAGKTMDELVKSVTFVTDIMKEISSASEEQSYGIDQISQAVSDMERVTQQNAALVEQSAATAASLEEHSNTLNQSVALFRLPGASQQRSGLSVARQAQPRPTGDKKDVARLSHSPEAGWETF